MRANERAALTSSVDEHLERLAVDRGLHQWQLLLLETLVNALQWRLDVPHDLFAQAFPGRRVDVAGRQALGNSRHAVYALQLPVGLHALWCVGQGALLAVLLIVHAYIREVGGELDSPEE